MTEIGIEWTVLPDAAAVAAATSERILAAAVQAIAVRGEFRLVLAGGETPLAAYRRLRDASADWSRWHLWFGDERCLPTGDRHRNDAMADAAWLDAPWMSAAQIHRVPWQKVGADETARAYARLLPDGPFDLVLLGLGEDGHTASLFPGQDWGAGKDAPPVLAVTHAPKWPAARISLSATRLAATRQLLFVVSGERKRTAVAAWRRGAAIPAAAIAHGPAVEVLLDAAANSSP